MLKAFIALLANHHLGVQMFCQITLDTVRLKVLSKMNLCSAILFLPYF